MGVFEWIGEAIGNACSAIAEFFGAVFEGIFAFFGGLVKDIGKDTLGGITEDVFDGDSTAQDDIETIGDVVTAPITEGWDHLMKIMDKRHSATTPEEGYDDTMELWNAAKNELTIVALLTTLVESLSFGQIEGAKDITRVADTTRGLSSFTNAASMMKYEAQFLTPYQRYINRLYPNRIAESSDLVRFALREVWDPTRRSELLAEDAPGQYYDYMREQGFIRERAADWWASHWVLPSVGQLNEMLHRTTTSPTTGSGGVQSTPFGGSYYNVIGPETWDRFVKYNDFDPSVRPWLKEISYNPYTRVDIRRMYDLGLVTKDEVYKNYIDLGYDEEHAEKMTVWTLAYVLAVEMRARYSKGWVTEAEVRTALLETGMPADRVDAYLEKIIKADAAERVAKERDLTKTDITRSVKKGLLTKDEGIERLIDLGYDEDEAAFIVDITVTESISAEIEADRDLSKADVIKGVADGVFTEAQGITMLMKLGYDQTEAQYILDIRVPPKKPEKMKPERDLTKAEIVKGVKKEIITWAQGAFMLTDMGYDSDEADFILAINVEALAGSPETWSEMQDIVNKGRKAQGLPVKEIPSGIRDIEGKLKEYAKERIEAVEAKKPRQEIISIDNKILPLKRQHQQLVEQYQKGR